MNAITVIQFLCPNAEDADELKEYATAYTARWSGPNEDKHDKKYAWKKIPPKDGDPVTRKERVNGLSKTYYWCPYHLQWTIHTPKECKRLPSGKGKSKLTDKKAFKRSQFKERKKAYIHAKAAHKMLVKLTQGGLSCLPRCVVEVEEQASAF